jgi:hypothetical protein
LPGNQQDSLARKLAALLNYQEDRLLVGLL